MNYPVWELEFGGGLLIAIIAVLHVYVSHFAIGGGLFLVITEHLAYRRGDQTLERYLQTHSRFFALLTLVFGAVTGVGIWFTIGLVSPAATSALIHTYVFGWAIEWVFFFVEIAAAIIYYTTWKRISRAQHLAVGWTYFGAAFLSLVVINGILTFMLTPGQWPMLRTFASGFFNPTYWPALVARTAFCIALAGMYALVTGVRVKSADTRHWLVRYAGVWAFAGAIVAIPSLVWYQTSIIGAGTEIVAGAQPVVDRALIFLTWGGIIFVLLALAPLIVPRHVGVGTATVLALVALAVFGGAEWTREALRKPYVIGGYMYGNGLRVDEVEALPARGGLLANAIWVEERHATATVECGRDVFRVACRSCHTVDGYYGLRDRLQGLDEPYVDALLRHPELLRGRMPPFPGTDIERQALAKYLVSLTSPRQGMIDGAEVFAKRCGSCHSKQGFRPLYNSFEGTASDEILETFGTLSDLDERMPPWTGRDEEARLLADHIVSWYGTESE